MVVIISNSVWDKIDEYARALTRYPITNKRAYEKVDHMIKFLVSLGNSVVSHLSVCIKTCCSNLTVVEIQSTKI